MIVLCPLVLLIGQGLQVRHQSYSRHMADHTPSADLAGFVSLAAGSEPIRESEVARSRFFTGWREPGPIHLIRLVHRFVGDYEKSWRLITFWSSCLLYLGACTFAYHFFGPLEATIVAWMWGDRRLIVILSGSGYREDLVALFVLATWFFLLKRQWKCFVIVTIVGSYVRLGHLSTSFVGFGALVLAGYLQLARPPAWDRSLIQTLRKPAVYLAIILAGVSPLLLYYKITWGSFFYPLDLILYDCNYFLLNQTWTVPVTGGFYNSERLIPDGFSFWSSFSSPSDFVVKILAGCRYVYWTSVRYYFLSNDLVFSSLYLAGACMAIWNPRTRPHVVLGFAFGLQFVPIAWIDGVLQYRFFVILQVYTILLIGYALAEAARTTIPGVLRAPAKNRSDLAESVPARDANPARRRTRSGRKRNRRR